MRWLDGITDSMDMNLSKLRKMVKDRGTCHGVVHWVAKSQTLLSYMGNMRNKPCGLMIGKNILSLKNRDDAAVTLEF